MLAVAFIVIAIFAGYFYIYRPEYVAMLLFSLAITNINFELPGMPLNTRALLSVLLFFRVLFDKKTISRYRSFLGNRFVQFFFLFVSYVLLNSVYQELFSFALLKEQISTLLIAFLAFHYFYFQCEYSFVGAVLILSGLVCFSDLLYTYIEYGGFPVRRIYFMFYDALENLTEEELVYITNHNFFGQICGITFVYIFISYLKDKLKYKASLFVLPFMFLGVVMSTSRSAIFALISVSALFMFIFYMQKGKKKMIIQIASLVITLFILGLMFAFQLEYLFDLKSEFTDEIIMRMVDEPVAVFQKLFGYDYNIYKLGSMDWREESSANAWNAYIHFNYYEQIFGIGLGGFQFRQLGDGYNAHNGLLLLLIENGIVGAILYLIFMINVVYIAFYGKIYSPFLGVILFIFLFGLGQNNEITSTTFFFFVISLVAEIQFTKSNKLIFAYEYGGFRKVY